MYVVIFTRPGADGVVQLNPQHDSAWLLGHMIDLWNPQKLLISILKSLWVFKHGFGGSSGFSLFPKGGIEDMGLLGLGRSDSSALGLGAGLRIRKPPILPLVHMVS